MVGKDLFYRLVGAAAGLSLALTACLPVIFSGASVTPKSEDVGCLFGPGTTFSPVAILAGGKSAPILGALRDHAWWEIEDPQAGGMHCWVPAPRVNTSGDLSRVPVVPVPSGLVTGLTIAGQAVIHSTCESDTTNPVSFKVTMTTNGPATVTYHLEVYNSAGTMLLIHTDDATRTFASASTVTFDTGEAFRTDCGDFSVKAIVTNPNAITARTSWSVVTP
jgi:uncharacterized protein YraI